MTAKAPGPASAFTSMSKGKRNAILSVVLAAVYLFYTSGITSNPPGFYLDEASVAYNAFSISQTGKSDSGHFLPLYFPMFPLGPPFDYLGYVESPQIYALALLNLVFPPSVALARGLSATAMFIASILLGTLGFQISRRRAVGVTIFVIALLTPWLFEIGRLTFGASLYPFTLALFLLLLYRAWSREKWRVLDSLYVAAGLALCTYTYAIGRMLGPLLAVALMLIITDVRKLKGVAMTWVFYAIAIIPVVVFHFTHPNALTGRYNMNVGYITPEKGYGEILSEFSAHYLANISPYRLLFVGDLNNRHHIPDAAAFLTVPALLTLAGIVVVFINHWRSSWWRYIIFCLIVSPIPASLTKDDFHYLRLAPFAVFLIVLMIPAVAIIFGQKPIAAVAENSPRASISPVIRKSLVAAAILLTLGQFVYFYSQFREKGPERGGYFDYNFPSVFAVAMEQPERPIYLPDQFFYHAWWQAAIQGIDQDNFVRLPPRGRPPGNAIVLSGEERCTDCQVLKLDIPFILYKTGAGAGQPVGSIPMTEPRGLAEDGRGGYYIADTGNSRIQKYDITGRFLGVFGSAGTGPGELKEPQGIAVDSNGRVYVSDALNHKLLQFESDGRFIQEWTGPEGGFYGPRDIAFGLNGMLYIVDQGRNRIARLDPSTGAFKTFGNAGSAIGQFNDPVGIATSPNAVFVADQGNHRIQVFDLEGNPMRMWTIPQWTDIGRTIVDVEWDEKAGKLYVTAGKHGILAFDPNGAASPAPDITKGAAATIVSLSISDRSTPRKLIALDLTKPGVLTTDLGPK